MSSGNFGDSHHLIARLEAFSDIVIGFSLAQTTVNLVVTKGLADYFAHPFGIIAYLGTFAIVARMWWSHSQIMHRLFVLNRLMVGLNFVSLAAIGLQVFALQLLLHQNGDNAPDYLLAIRFYFICFSVSIGSLAVMRLLGLYYRWAHVSGQERRDAASKSLTALAVCVPVIIAAVIPSRTQIFGIDAEVIPANLFFAYLAGGLLSAILKEMLKRSRWGFDSVQDPSHAG